MYVVAYYFKVGSAIARWLTALTFAEVMLAPVAGRDKVYREDSKPDVRAALSHSRERGNGIFEQRVLGRGGVDTGVA